MANQTLNKAYRSLAHFGLVAAAALLLAAPQSQAELACTPDLPASRIPVGTRFILKKKINVQEVSHESDHFGRETACSFWVGKPQSDDFQDEIENGITFRPQTFTLSEDSKGGNKFWLKTEQNKVVTLYCDPSAKITSLSTLRAALKGTFTIAVPAGTQRTCRSVTTR